MTTSDGLNEKASSSVSADTPAPAVKEESGPVEKQVQSEPVTGEKKRTDQNEVFSLRVKKNFVLDKRASCLPDIPVEEAVPVDDWDRQGKQHRNKRGKHQQKKKRPRDVRIEAGEKMCLSVIRGTKCPYGDGCRYSHDMKAFLGCRPADISGLDGGMCPLFKLYGFCQYGVMCRFGSSHVNMATGENKRVDPPEGGPPKPVVNILSKDVQQQLRKKTYPFKCKRYNDRKDDEKASSPKDSTDVSQPPAGNGAENNTPYPTKTRKLIDFSSKVYVAPLTTVGNLPFRRVMKRFGADITCGEMAVATNLLGGHMSEWALLKRHPEEDVFGVQIAAGFPDVFTRTAQLLEEQVGDGIDFVDLNLGCPLDLVCDKGAGAALMNRDKRLKDSLHGITKHLSCPVTIKMRTGWDMSKPFAHELVPKIQGWGIDGVAAVMVHGRSRLQRYSRESDWDYISKVAASQDPSLPTIPVIGNGDIFSYTDYEDKVKREGSGLSSCAMLARGALIKPWLPTEIKERRHWDISATERLDFLKDFVRFGLEHWGSDQQGVNNCRRFLLEWLSFLHRYVPVGLLDVLPQQMNQRIPAFICGRSDLETLFLSSHSSDWIRISEMLLGPVPDGFRFEPKHKAKGYK